jgi:hypothetical protein
MNELDDRGKVRDKLLYKKLKKLSAAKQRAEKEEEDEEPRPGQVVKKQKPVTAPAKGEGRMSKAGASPSGSTVSASSSRLLSVQVAMTSGIHPVEGMYMHM